jgi:FMN phosphatase YigB (HAD superfamily)
MLMAMHIRAVIFDRDNTLVRCDPASVAALEARVVEIAPMIPLGAVTKHWTAWPGPWPCSVSEEFDFWRAFWRSLAAHYQISDSATRALQEIGALYHTCFTAFPDAVSCLSALRARGMSLAVLTNFKLPSIHLTLQYAGIDPRWFKALLCSSTLGIAKPDARAYLATARALDLASCDCLFVDDLPANVAAACEVGMRGILLDRERTAQPSIFEQIYDLDSLADLDTEHENVNKYGFERVYDHDVPQIA